MRRTLDLEQCAAELGRSADWLRNHWRRLVADERMPRPVSGDTGNGGKLAWNSAQLYAWLDRRLTPAERAAAAAYRASAEAYADTAAGRPNAVAEIAASRERLDARLRRSS